jgi:hypothetical protein
MTTDAVTNSLGKPGKFQVLFYLYLASNWIYISWNHLGMTFIGAKTKHHCTVANSTDVSLLVPLKSKNGKSVWDGCHLFDGYNTSEKIPCPNGWTYDLPEGEATIISEVKFSQIFPVRAVARHDNWGGGGCIFIYSCSHTVKTIAFKRNPSGRTRVFEYAPPVPGSLDTNHGSLLWNTI